MDRAIELCWTLLFFSALILNTSCQAYENGDIDNENDQSSESLRINDLDGDYISDDEYGSEYEEPFYLELKRGQLLVPRLGRSPFVPRLGRSAPLTPRLGRSPFTPRLGRSAFTPRLGRAFFAPRLGRIMHGEDDDWKKKRAFTPRLG